MPAIVADTHSFVWRLVEPARLSTAASQAMDDAVSAGDPVYVSVISIVELIYLVEKGRIAQEALDRLNLALQSPDAEFIVAPLTREVANDVRLIPRDEVPDMPDRIIAATALHLNLPLVTRDKRIRASRVPAIW